MDNPFEYSKPLPAGAMVDRDAELQGLGDQLASTHNSRLVGPRRYGKTTLINAALARARDDGLVAIEVNFLGVLTLEDIAERIERAYSEQLDSRLQRWLTGVVRTLRPTVSAGGGPVPASVAVSPQASTGALLDRLALPRRVHDKHGVRCAIAFDEFQAVLRAGENADAVIRSEIERHAGVAGYVFSGSHVGMMRELFADRRRAFFGQATPIDLRPLSPADLAEYVTARFEGQRRDPGDALGPLLDLAEGHPQRALLLAHKLFAHTPPRSAADTDTWTRALRDACREAEPEVVGVWERLASTAQRVLAAIADGAVTLNSRDARERYGLSKTGSNQQAVRHLADEAHISPSDRTPTEWAVVDPLLALWLRHGRAWPDFTAGSR
jgi:hypothetical protein